MARGKKKESALTPEEKLMQALMPEENQPYKVPKNWCWTKAGNMVTLYRGVSYKKNDAHTEKGENDCLIMRGGNISEGEIDTEADNVYVNKDLVTQEQLVKKHDIIIVSSTGSTKVIGRAGISLMDYDDVAFGAFLTLLRPVDYVSKSFVDYYFQSDLYRERIRSLASGVNINNIRTEYITESPVPLPPLAEQQRIVDRIESLFAKLDEAKEKAQSVLDSFETRKAAILHKAFTGELTAKWRAEHGVEIDDWQDCLLGDIFDMKAGKNISASKINSEKTLEMPYPCFGGNGIRGYVEIYNQEGEHPIIGRQGALCGNVNLASGTFYATEHAVVVSYKLEVATTWAVHYLRFLNLNQYATATAQPGLAVGNIMKVSATYIPYEEQLELAKIIDSIFAKEHQAKEAAEAVLEKIDLLKKSILARAFRGELGTNDPTDEPALDLLKRII